MTAQRASSPRGAGSTPAGVPPSSSGLSLETLPLPRCGRAGFGLLRRRPSLQPRPASPVPLQVRRAGLVSQPTPRWGPAQTRSCSLSSLIPRRSRRRQASSPEARWPGSEGGHAATGVRCAPSELWGRAAVMAVFAECPILGKGRPRRGDPAPAQRAVARAASPCSDRGCYPRSASSGQENHDRPPRFAPAQRSQGSGSGGVTSPWAEPAQWFTAPQTQNPPGEAE